MKILVCGCIHSFWKEMLNEANKLISEGTNIDLIIICGDTQTFRSEEDFSSSCILNKYRKLSLFVDIYNGSVKPPCPIILIGGNHENSEMLFRLPFGGYLCDNVFYLGRAGQIKFGTLRISGISGVFSSKSYFSKVHETLPIQGKDAHTAYHYRSFSEFQLCGLTKTDIMLSHDWPNIFCTKFNDPSKSFLSNYTRGLCRGDIIVNKAQPKYWFSAHHHYHYSFNVNNTSFFAYSKPYTAHKFFDVFDIDGTPGPIKYTGEWIAILRATSKYMEDPSILRNVNWENEWKNLQLEDLPDMDALPYNSDLLQTTEELCQKFGITLP